MNIEEKNQLIENGILSFPIFEYKLISRDDIVFSDKVRYICENECENYGKSWACPPAVGSVKDCMERCHEFSHGLLFSTIAEVSDCMNFAECLEARRDHEELSREIKKELSSVLESESLLLTTGCMVCDKCAYPHEECRNPQIRTSSVESHGIVIMQTASEAGLSYDCGGNMVTYFSLILYN